MRKILLTLLLPLSVYSQNTNLVPNPSFEELLICPDAWAGFLSFTTPYTTHWTEYGSADYYHVCAIDSAFSIPYNAVGTQHPVTGTAYAGLFPINTDISNINNFEVREYLFVELLDSLKKNHYYKVGFYFSAAEGGNALSRGIGMQLSNQSINDSSVYYPITNSTIIDTSIVDTLNYDDWFLLEKIYQAQGGEKHIAIGLFGEKEDVLATTVFDTAFWNQYGHRHSYTLIDDVFVYPIEEGGSTAISEQIKPKELVHIVDVFGRESRQKPNTPLFYIYDDGTVEKRIIVE